MGSGMPASHPTRPVLSPRDQAVVELVSRFGQLTGGQIGSVLFADQASKTPLDRCLKRLVERRYLARLTRPVGGHGGGSASYVYQLGRAGWRLLGRPGKYWPFRAVNLHTMAIADCFVTVTAAERAGACALLRFDPEPDVPMGEVKLTPDALVELGYRDRGVRVSCFLEVDRATEHRETIKDKCVRYWRAYQSWDDEVFPIVVFIVPDKPRQRELERVVAAGPADAQQLFRVCTRSTFGEVIHRIS